MQFNLAQLPPQCAPLQQQVRAFIAENLQRSPAERALSWAGGDATFSRALGRQGWIGMTWPKRYGGHERSALERYIVLEELLACGAPVGCHWIADRQSGPLLLRAASEEQKQHILPAIARGECFFCIGMSEPDTGSDLASVRSRAVQTDSGWLLNGTKVWTTGAHESHYMIALVRTSGSADDRHKGLSQFLVDLSLPGVEVTPIPSLAGAGHFNQVRFADVSLAPDALLGEEGAGWAQVTSELALERSGPERFLSSLQLLLELVQLLGEDAPAAARQAIGKCFAQLMGLRQMSLSIAAMLEDGERPDVEAALVKDLGALFEQSLPLLAQSLVDETPGSTGSDYRQVLAVVMRNAPSFSLRGGTREILRGIIARGLGLR